MRGARDGRGRMPTTKKSYVISSDDIVKIYERYVLRLRYRRVTRCTGRIDKVPLTEYEIRQYALQWFRNFTGHVIREAEG